MPHASRLMTVRKDKIFALAKGFRGRAKNCYRIAIRAVEKALQAVYVSRRLKKRTVRTQWISQIGAGSREHGLGYGRLIEGMTHAKIGVDRKILSQLAQQEPYTFRAIVEEAKLGLQRAYGSTNKPAEPPRTMVPDADAPSTVERGHIPRYEGPPLPPYPTRYKHFS